MPTLVLVSHGSHLNANSSANTHRTADLIRASGLYDHVLVASWKEEPSLRQVLKTVPGTSVTVLPAFMSEGYFTETVIPRELGLTHQGKVPAEGVCEEVQGRQVHYLPPYGTHERMADILVARAREVLPGWNAQDTALIVLGHGTTENDHSREAIAKNAELLRSRDLFAEVHDFYLDEEPRVLNWAQHVKAPQVVIVPFFASEGWHTQETIPQELGLAGQETNFGTQKVYYAKPVGTHPDVAQVILELARGAREVAPQPDLPVGEHEQAWQQIKQQASLTVGEVKVRRAGDTIHLNHVLDTNPAELRRIFSITELRQYTQRTADGKHRPIRTFTDLPRGWRAELPASELRDALHTLYPAVIEEKGAEEAGTLTVTPWADTAARQTGLYRTVQQATPEQVQAQMQVTCGGCLRSPRWAGQTEGLPCAEACTLLVAHVRDRVNAEKPHQQAPVNAFVSLVGAGPGDPELLTVKALKALQTADVVLYDALANPALLAHAGHAELIQVGKRGFRESASQDDINALIVHKAREGTGKRVVRLKGGDPFVFGRGGEEALACRAAHLPCEVVPGISSALSGPAYAGIPVTHRKVARSFAVLTGMEESGPARYRELGSVDTLVFLMALKNLGTVCADLIAAGRRPDTPAATIQDATLPTQRVVTGTLTTIAAQVREAGIQAPALTVVGDVVNLRDSLHWFTPQNQALSGKKVVVTRTREQPSRFAAMLRGQGADVKELPLVRFGPSSQPRSVIGALKDFQGWMTFTSEQAVKSLFPLLDAHGLDARALARIKLAAVGAGTAEELQKFGLRADFTPSRSGSKHLGAELPAEPGELVLHLTDQHGEDALELSLQARGIEYHALEAYRTEGVTLSPAQEEALLDADTVTLASATGARYFAQVAGTDWPVTVIGPQTLEAARQAGFTRVTVAETATLEGLLNAVGRAKKQPEVTPVNPAVA